MRLTHRSTIFACYNGYITQAICINLAPLLYLTFQRNYQLSLAAISSLIAFNFLTQLLVDWLASFFSDRMNLRLFTVLAHLLTVIGLLGLSFFPTLLAPYWGLVLAVSCLGIGGGLTEVLISPIMEACPTDQKSGNMSLLHSFYCWGQAGVVLFSGIFFSFFEPDRYWQYLPVFWALIPFIGILAFCFVPLYRLPAEENGGHEICKLFKMPLFWCFLLMMFCAGASEMVMSQWASGFAESALGVSKSVGDLAGPCMFAVMMGSARALYGKFSEKIALEPFMMGSCLLCTLSYLLAAFGGIPALSLIGCATCGFSVGIFWPGVLSRASASIAGGGITLFALLAVAGDMGCLAGPFLAGLLSDLFGGDLRWAFCFAIIFPLIQFLVLLFGKKKKLE